MKRMLASLLIVCALGLFVSIAYGHGSSIIPYITTFIRTLLDDSDAETSRDTLEAAGWSTTSVTSGSSAGDEGDLWADSDYLYVCYADNSWKKLALTNVTVSENVVYNAENVVYAGEQVVYP